MHPLEELEAELLRDFPTSGAKVDRNIKNEPIFLDLKHPQTGEAMTAECYKDGSFGFSPEPHKLVYGEGAQEVHQTYEALRDRIVGILKGTNG